MVFLEQVDSYSVGQEHLYFYRTQRLITMLIEGLLMNPTLD